MGSCYMESKENENQENQERNKQTEIVPADQANMPLSGHLDEFRFRLIICLVVVTAASGIAYAYVEDIIAAIAAPAGKLYFLNPAEVFFSYIKIAVFTGCMAALPVLCYEVWAFVRPALKPSERVSVWWFIPTVVLLFYAGLAFSYVAVLPAAVTFFMGFATDTLQPMFSLDAYLSFFIAFELPFGIVFELPLILFLLAKAGLITSTFLKSKRKIMIVIAFVFAAIVSPTTDIFTQAMIAVPMILLYEFSIVLVKWLLRK